MAECKGKLKVAIRVSVKDKNTNEESQVWTDEHDIGTVQQTQIFEAQLLNKTQTTAVKDITGTAETVSANSTISAVDVVAGTGGTTAAVTDYVLGAQSSDGQGSQAATVNAVSTSTGVFTVTANMSAPSSGTIVYHEVGITITIGSYTFLITRDYNGTGWSVDTTHYLAVTYTITPS